MSYFYDLLNEDDFDTLMTLQQSVDAEKDNFEDNEQNIQQGIPADEAYKFSIGPATLYGFLDQDQVSVIVKGINGTNSNTIAKELVNAVIHDIETNHRNMDAIVWEVGKGNFQLVEFLTKCQFVIHETTSETFIMVYHLQNIVAPKDIFSGGGTDGDD
jgi:hypothetical protein